MDLVLTSGGLGPTADDLTAEVVGRFQGREMVLDEALSRAHRGDRRAAARSAGRTSTREAIARGQPQAGDDPARRDACSSRSAPPRGSSSPPSEHGATARPSSCCRARRASCSRCGARRSTTDALQRGARAARRRTAQRMLRLFGIPESEIAETLRVAEREGVALERLEITTCLKRGEIEVVTRYEPDRAGRLRGVRRGRRASATPTRCSRATAARSTSRSRRCCAAGRRRRARRRAA